MKTMNQNEKLEWYTRGCADSNLGNRPRFVAASDGWVTAVFATDADLFESERQEHDAGVAYLNGYDGYTLDGE